MKYYKHKSSFIDKNVTIGVGTKIWHFSHILPNTSIGKNCTIGQNVLIGPNVKIGNKCKIQNNISIYQGVELEDGVFCGPSMVFTNIKNPRTFIERKKEFNKTLVKKGASIGANATILCGNIIGKYALIAAGSIITKNVPNYSLFIGTPAKHSGWVCKCGKVLTKILRPKNTIQCKECKKKYKYQNNNIKLSEVK